MGSPRSIAVDVARGLAVVLMIQTHAYDGWVRADVRDELAFRFTRFLGVLPLPTFLLLAGLGTALRIESALRKDESPAAVRAALVRRGLEVLASGYALNVVLGVIDGGVSLATFLRVDVLHAIGLSIVLSAPLACRAPLGTARLGVVGAAIVVGMAAVVIPLTHLGRSTTGPLRFLVGLFVEVPSVTKMPVVPLAAFLGVGLAFGAWARGTRWTRRRYAVLAIVAAAVAAIFVVVETRLAAAIPGAFDRTHPAILANLIELSARAVALVALVFAIDPPATSRLARWLALLGRHSLVGYAVHLPFAYGRIPKAIARSLAMPEATAFFVLLVLGTTAVVAIEDRRERAALSKPTPAP